MKPKIRHKLFFTLFLSSTVVATGLFFYLQWSFDRGFLNYVRSQEITILGRMASQLSEYYEKQGSWEFMAGNHVLWREIHRNLLPSHSGEPQSMNHHGPPRDGRKGPPAPPHRPRNIGPRVILFGADKEKIIGGSPRDLTMPSFLHPIDNNGEVIGYLGLVPVTELSETGDLRFVQNQTRNFALVTLAMVILSLLFTYPFTAHLLRPIKELTRGTRKLIGGKFATRIPITSGDELGQLSHDFNILATTLGKNEQARRQWVADISHELRTPLSVLRGEIEAILDGVRGLTFNNLEPLHGEVRHLERLVNDLYELSMSDIGALTYKKVEVNPVGILEEAIDLFEKRFESRGIVLNSNFQSDFSSSLLADPDRLHQLFSNLLENSLRYTDAPGNLEVSIAHDSDYIDIFFKDSAPGVEPQKLEKIFERLYRVTKSRKGGDKGAGLGLSICSNIVEAHRGNIIAQSSPYGGLAFHIRFPISS